MSNYRTALAIANNTKSIVPPNDESWWQGFTSFLTERYDTPQIEKAAAQEKCLPMFMYWEGEDVFPNNDFLDAEAYQQKLLFRNAFYMDKLPLNHPIHTGEYPPDCDLFLNYGGDYWLNEVFRNHEFWNGLHKAGTRGLFTVEIGCELSIEFQGFSYHAGDSALWPASFLIAANLKDEKQFSLERIYPRKELYDSGAQQVKAAQEKTLKNKIEQEEDFDEEAQVEEKGFDNSLNFFKKYAGKVIDEALCNPNRQPITLSELSCPDQPWSIR